MCLAPCPAGKITYRPGQPNITYDTPLEINTRRSLDCPFCAQRVGVYSPPCNADAGIEILCQNDGKILVITKNCGAHCSQGLLPLTMGGGNLQYPVMVHGML